MPTWYEGSPDVLVRVKVRGDRDGPRHALQDGLRPDLQGGDGAAVFVGFNAHGDDWKEKGEERAGA